MNDTNSNSPELKGIEPAPNKVPNLDTHQFDTSKYIPCDTGKSDLRRQLADAQREKERGRKLFHANEEWHERFHSRVMDIKNELNRQIKANEQRAEVAEAKLVDAQREIKRLSKFEDEIVLLEDIRQKYVELMDKRMHDLIRWRDRALASEQRSEEVEAKLAMVADITKRLWYWMSASVNGEPCEDALQLDIDARQVLNSVVEDIQHYYDKIRTKVVRECINALVSEHNSINTIVPCRTQDAYDAVKLVIKYGIDTLQALLKN
jgi:hypothetical protein